MPNELKNAIHSQFQIAWAGGVPSIAFQDGSVLSLADTAQGIATVTLKDEWAIDANECVAVICAKGAAFGVATITHTSDTVKVFSVFDAAAAALDNIPLDVTIFRFRTGT